MSSKHWDYKKDLVLSHLAGLCQSNPHVRLIESERVVISAENQEDKITLISGGGSGHEPLHAGFVTKDGLLDAAVAGFIFASPSTKQIFSAIKAKPSKKGTLIIVKNYTGDILHFGLAAEKAKAEGLNAELLIVQDDVSVGKAKNGLVGRRGLAGTSLVHKILGAKAYLQKDNLELHQLVTFGEKVVANLITIGASLDHVTIPARANKQEEDDSDDEHGYEVLKHDEFEIGMGIHNEPGIKKSSPIPTVDELVAELLEYLLSTTDKDRNYVQFDKNDEVVLLINNLGGTSVLELYAIQNVVVDQLASKYSIKPVRIFTGTFTTSLDGPGFSITLLNATKTGDKDILKFLDHKTSAPGWNSNISDWSGRVDNFIVAAPEIDEGDSSSKVSVNGKLYAELLESGVKKVISKEPKITLYDTVAGDGDCGETLANGSNAILKALAEGKLDLKDGVKSLVQITDIVETAMGGTSGGLYSIFISALAKSLKEKELSEGAYTLTLETISGSLQAALQSLFKYTRARTGDRTLIDALEPFVKEFAKSKDLKLANKAAHDGAEATRKFEAKFGRASYVAEEEFKQFESEGGLPDPGAIGLAALISGITDAYFKSETNL
ncbi:hypothetical protein LJB42_003861 [Komagataella kurtzmanii]|nr:hypothetical protein LJB42_003861 [Komagataella kurtzmanii]